MNTIQSLQDAVQNAFPVNDERHAQVDQILQTKDITKLEQLCSARDLSAIVQEYRHTIDPEQLMDGAASMYALIRRMLYAPGAAPGSEDGNSSEFSAAHKVHALLAAGVSRAIVSAHMSAAAASIANMQRALHMLSEDGETVRLEDINVAAHLTIFEEARACARRVNEERQPPAPLEEAPPLLLDKARAACAALASVIDAAHMEIDAAMASMQEELEIDPSAPTPET